MDWFGEIPALNSNRIAIYNFAAAYLELYNVDLPFIYAELLKNDHKNEPIGGIMAKICAKRGIIIEIDHFEVLNRLKTPFRPAKHI